MHVFSYNGVNYTHPVSPQVQPYNFIKLGAVSDRDLGALIVKDNGSTVSFSADVVADPCPNIMWSFNGTRLGPSNETFTYNNACLGAATRDHVWTFTLGVMLIVSTSGKYSASFSNIAGTTSLSKLYFTIPGMSTIF